MITQFPSGQMLSKLKLTTLLPVGWQRLGFTLLFYSVFLTSPTNACDLMYDGWQEMSVEERTMQADAVASGRVIRQVHPSIRNKTGFMYAADVKILEIYKGYRHFTNVSSLGSASPSVFRILGFGERKRCYSEAHDDQEYILFLTSYSLPGDEKGRGLSAKYDDFHGAVVKLSKKHEEQVLSTLGWKPWSSWSSCPVSCGGGVQRQRRLCVKDVADACEGSAEQIRNCNEFGCTGVRNLLQILPLSFFPKGVRRTPLRWQSYRLRAFADLRTDTSTVFPHGFPQEFSIIMSVRPKYSRQDDSELYVLVVTDPNGDIDFGIQLGDVPSIVYSERVGDEKRILTQSFPEYKLTRDWHTMAFSIRESTVHLYVDCSTVFKYELVAPVRIDPRGQTSIGSPTDKPKDIYFEGDIEQLVLIADPDAAELQCVEPQNLIPSLSSHSWESSNTPWEFKSDAEIPFDLLIPPPHFQSWEEISPRQATANAILTTKKPRTSSLPATPVTTTVDSNRGWHKLTRPHPATNFVPLPRIIKSNTVTPASGTVDINLLPPPNTSQPLLPKPPANIVGSDTLLPEGLPGQLGLDESSGDTNAGFGELLSRVPGQDSGKNVNSGGGHDVPLDVTLPQDPHWSRGDAPPERYIPPPNSNPTTVGSTKLPEPYQDYTDYSSALPATLPIFPTDSEAVVTTPVLTTEIPKTTTLTTIQGKNINSIIKAKATTTKSQPETTNRPDFNNDVPLNDAGVVDSGPAKKSSEETDITRWSTWSTCSKSCGSGIRYRFTFCTQDSNLTDCILRGGRGIASETKECYVRDCEEITPVRWSGWSECSRSCGEGLQTRMALCPSKPTIPECVGRSTVVQRRPCTGNRCVCSPRCLNGGHCNAVGSCVCQSGFTGSQCQNTLRSYSRCNPRCANGGTCLSSTIPSRCACRKGYTGPACKIALIYTGIGAEVSVAVVDTKTVCQGGCRNGGRCVAPDTCSCPSTYQGQNCLQPICRTACQNGGKCTHPDVCRCPRGYRGPQCQLYYCRQSCRNGGRCVGPDKCSCQAGFTGDICQRSECFSHCPRGSMCLSPGRCASVGTGVGGSGNSNRMTSYSKSCRLTSYVGPMSQSYVKPELKTTQYRCGPYLSSICQRTRMQYSQSYRTHYKTMYKMMCREPT